MELKQIKELMEALCKAGLSRLKLKIGQTEIELERKVDAPAPPPPPPEATPEPPPQKEELGHCIISPIVGIFYASPAPDEASFVKAGDEVEEDSVVCIVEAMKVMNEVKAATRGRIKKVLVESGHPVEFGTKLFECEKS